MLAKPHREFFNRAISVSVAMLLATGCTHSAKTVSYKFVALPSAAGTGNSDKFEVKRGDTVFVDAKPIEPLALPVYPTDLPKPSDDSVTIVIRIIVGPDGTVEDIRRSMADFSPPTPFSRACFESAKHAVAQWKFEPALVAVVAPQTNGRPLILSSTPTDRPFEIAFRFSSSGQVAPDFSKR